MENRLSTEPEQYFRLIQQLLEATGSQVNEQNLINLLQIVKEYCPWFPNKGILDLEVWGKVGQRSPHNQGSLDKKKKGPMGWWQR